MPSSKHTDNGGRKRRRTFKRRDRDYQAEYARRIALAQSRGESRSKGRGHARAGERPVPKGPRLIKPTFPEEQALRLIMEGKAVRAAAKVVGVSEERVRRYMKENTTATRIGRKWHITDTRPRQFPVFSAGKLVSPWLSVEETAKAHRYLKAVQTFYRTGDEVLFDPFVGGGVTDVYGRYFRFETDPNVLFELDAAGELNFPEIYRIVGGQL